MNKKKILLTIPIFCVLLTWMSGLLPASAAPGVPTKVTIVDKKNKSISKKTVATGSRFELDAKVNPGAEDDWLEWKIISGKKVVKFVNHEKYGDGAELKALKAGTAKVKVYVHGKTGKRVKDTITIKVKKASASSGGKISAKGSKIKYEEVHDDFDLEVVKSRSSISNSQLKWSIKDRSVVDFANERKMGREVEFYAKKTGTTKITCEYVVSGKTKSSVTFTVNVVWGD